MQVRAVPIEEPTNLGAEGRQEERSSLFLAAVMRVGADQVAVKVRNMSLHGAMVDSPLSPPARADVQLIRGSLVANAKIIWSSKGRCGLRFTSEVSIDNWLASPSKAEQQRVDEIITLVKAGAIPLALSGPAAKLGAGFETGPQAAGELEPVIALLLDLEDDLARSVETLNRHAAKLQNLDIARQMLRAIADGLAGTPHDGSALKDLRIVCAQALAKR